MAEGSEVTTQQVRTSYCLKTVNAKCYFSPYALLPGNLIMPIAGKTPFGKPILTIDSPFLIDTIYAWVFLDKKDGNWYIVKNEGGTVEMVFVNGVPLKGIVPCRLVVNDVIELGTSGINGRVYVVFSDDLDRQVTMAEVEVLIRSPSVEGRFRDESVFSRRVGSGRGCLYCMMVSRVFDVDKVCFKCYSRLSRLEENEMCPRDLELLDHSGCVAVTTANRGLKLTPLQSAYVGNGYDVVFTGLKAKVAFVGHGNNFEFAEYQSTFCFEGDGNRVTFAGSTNALAFKGNGNRVTFSGSGNRMIINGSGNWVTFAGRRNQLLVNGVSNHVTFEGNHNFVGIKGSENAVTFAIDAFSGQSSDPANDELPKGRGHIFVAESENVFRGPDDSRFRIADKLISTEPSGNLFLGPRNFFFYEPGNKNISGFHDNFWMDESQNRIQINETGRAISNMDSSDYRFRLANLIPNTYGYTSSIFEVEGQVPSRESQRRVTPETQEAIQDAINQTLRGGMTFGTGITIQNIYNGPVMNTQVHGDGNRVNVGNPGTGT